MTKPRIVRHVSGDWSSADDHICLRVEADDLAEPADLRFVPGDIEALVTLLLMLSVKAAADSPPDTPSDLQSAIPLPLDSISIGEDESGDVVLQFSIGRASLAFLLPATASRELGHSLLTLSALPATGSG